MPLIETVYGSAAVRPFRDAELALLLSKARLNNEVLGVSGLLVYHRGSFLQAIEGEEAAIDKLFALIAKDPRHNRIQLLSRQPIEARSFSDWKMGFVKVDPALALKLPGHFDMFKADKGFDELKAAESRPAFFLRGFLDGKWRRYVEGR